MFCVFGTGGGKEFIILLNSFGGVVITADDLPVVDAYIAARFSVDVPDGLIRRFAGRAGILEHAFLFKILLA